MCILQYDGNGTTQVILVYQLDIDTVIGDAAAFNVVKPVSYTHLDVYKRQVLGIGFEIVFSPIEAFIANLLRGKITDDKL